MYYRSKSKVRNLSYKIRLRIQLERKKKYTAAESLHFFICTTLKDMSLENYFVTKPYAFEMVWQFYLL